MTVVVWFSGYLIGLYLGEKMHVYSYKRGVIK